MVVWSYNLTVPGPAFRLLIFNEIRLNPVPFDSDPIHCHNVRRIILMKILTLTILYQTNFKLVPFETDPREIV